MMNEVLSLLVWCRHDQQTDTMQLKIVSVDTGKEVQLHEGSFLLRIFSVEDGSVLRCFIRHIASGREAYVQGGPHLQTFVKACLLQDRELEAEFFSPERAEELSSESQGNEPESRSTSTMPDGSAGDADRE
jgi:hypothetical protein